ncbi:MAG: peptidylprolyl isomerase [Acidimicrobiia bacterium]
MAQYDSQPEMTIDLDKTYSATLHTNHGDIDIEFDAMKSPLTVNNFVFLARDGFYDGVIFHRVIKGFMIQGGDPTGTGTGGPGYRFRDELERPGSYNRGTVAMANAGPNTNGSQFFIMHTDYGLPHKYTIFGQVTDGLDVVDTIANTPTGPQDRPHDDCVINSVTITEN